MPNRSGSDKMYNPGRNFSILVTNHLRQHCGASHLSNGHPQCCAECSDDRCLVGYCTASIFGVVAWVQYAQESVY